MVPVSLPVFPGSPAASSGVVADRDYMVGCMQFEFADVEDFSQKMKVLFDIEVDPALDMYMYDIGNLRGRYVTIKPSNLWKGNGLLGVEFGAGVFDSRLLREMIESRAKEINPPLIDIQTSNQYFQPKFNSQSQRPNVITHQLPGPESINSNEKEGYSSTEKTANNSTQNSNSSLSSKVPSEACYLEVKDKEGRVFRVFPSNLLPSHQFPLRQFVYKA